MRRVKPAQVISELTRMQSAANLAEWLRIAVILRGKGLSICIETTEVANLQGPKALRERLEESRLPLDRARQAFEGIVARWLKEPFTGEIDLAKVHQGSFDLETTDEEGAAEACFQEAKELKILAQQTDALGDYQLAAECFDRAIALLRETNTRQLAFALSFAGSTQFDIARKTGFFEDWKKTIQYLIEAAKRFENLGITTERGYALNLCGEAYLRFADQTPEEQRKLKCYQIGLKYIEETLSPLYFLRIPDKIAYAHNNIGYAHFRIGVLTGSIDAFEKAIDHLQKAAADFKRLGIRESEQGKKQAAHDLSYASRAQLEIAVRSGKPEDMEAAAEYALQSILLFREVKAVEYIKIIITNFKRVVLRQVERARETGLADDFKKVISLAQQWAVVCNAGGNKQNEARAHEIVDECSREIEG